MQERGLDKIKIGRRVAEIRRRSGKTTAAFARSLGAEAKTVGRIERGENLPSTMFLVACAEEGGSSVDWILTGKGKAPRARVKAAA